MKVKNLIKRSLSMITVLSLLVTMLTVIPVSAAETTYTFDGYSETNGTTGPNGLGGSFSTSAFTISNGTDEVYGSTAVISNKNTLKNGYPELQIKPTFPNDSSIVIETAFKIESDGAETRIDMWGYSDGQGRYPLTFTTGGSIQVAGGSIGSYQTNTWYNIRMIFNPTAETLAITIDGGSFDNYTIVREGFGDGLVPGRICVPGIRGGNGAESIVHVGYINYYFIPGTANTGNSEISFEDWTAGDFSTKFNKTWRGWEVPTNRFVSAAIVETDDVHGKSFRWNHPGSSYYLQQFKAWPQYMPGGAFTEGKRVMEFSTKMWEGSVLRCLLGHSAVSVNGSNKTYFENVQIEMDKANTLTNGSTYKPTHGEWYRVRWVVDLDNQTLTTYMVNENNPADCMSNVMDFPWTVSDITYIAIGHAENGDGFYNYVDDIRVYEPTSLVPFFSNPVQSGNGSTMGNPVIEFNMPLDASTLTSDNVILSGGERAVAYDVSVDRKGNGIVVTPRSELDAHTVYTINVTTGVKDIFGQSLNEAHSWSFKTGDAMFDGVVITPDTLQAGDITASVSFDTEEAQDVTLLFALYSKATNKLEACQLESTTAANGTLDCSLTVPANPENYYVKAFVWDSESARPYIECATLGE